MTENERDQAVVQAALDVVRRRQSLPLGCEPSEELDILDLAVRRAGYHRGTVYGDLTTAQAAADRGTVVVKLAPLARWIVVERSEYERWGEACGWELESAGTECRSWMLAQAAACMVGLGFAAVVEDR